MEFHHVPLCIVSFSIIIFLLPNLLSAHGIHKLQHNNGESYRQVDGEVYKVLVNGTAKIKCDISSSLPNDQVLLVVWYKNNLPIYSYDTRGAHAGTPSEWHDMEVLENRARLEKSTGPAVLIIDPVAEKDAGNFRCRVDFKLSPTRNSNVNLEVIVPPQAPKIYNEKREFIDGRAGPYEEGADLHLICVVTGGSPAPTITWSSNGQVLTSTSPDFSFPYSQSSKLIIHNMSRIHQHSVYTCQASNFHERAIATNVTVELYLRPLSVDLLTGNQPLSADRSYPIQCQSVGSRPPAKITWWLNGTQIESTNVTVSSDGNVSLSTLSFVPTRKHHNKILACRASNELVKRGLKETFVKLNIFFVPTLTLVLGSNLNPLDIEEGDDVYFECNVEANPAAYKIVWKHNGQMVQHNHKAGVIMSSSNLALQGISRHQAGNYTCIASNVEGDGESQSYPLKVMYKPICRPDQKRIYGVARNEAAEILCEVDAYPAPESFKWSFNNTAETFDMPQSGYRLHSEQASTLTYTPVKEMDFGTIMCWADNVVGQQKEPCIFHLIAAGKPDQPYNCTVINQTSGSLEIDCNEGFDGGQKQWFILEIYDDEFGLLQANLSSKYPVFVVDGLEPNRLMKLVVYAANVKGRSGVVILEASTLKIIEKPTLKFGQQYNQFELMSMLSIAIIVGVLTVLICIGIVIYILKLRLTKSQHNHHLHPHQKSKLTMQNSNNILNNNSSNNNSNLISNLNCNNSLIRPGNLPIKEKILLPVSQSEELYDEKNPDVVPYNEGITTSTMSPAISINNFHPHHLHNKQMHHQQPVAPPPPPPTLITSGFQQQSPQSNSNGSTVNNSISSSGIANSLLNHSNSNNNSNNCMINNNNMINNSNGSTTTSSTGGGIPPIYSPPTKPFLREIVTIRTPLFTQQESCV